MADKKPLTQKEINKLERITGEDTRRERLQALINQIPEYVEDFCIKYNVENLTTVSANIFNALLMEIGEKLIRPNKEVLKTQYSINNAYDLNQVDVLLDEYIRLSRIYDNPVTILGFSTFSTIHVDQLNAWKYSKTPHANVNNIATMTNKDERQTLCGSAIYEKLITFEESTTLQCRKYNDLRIIARLNRITGGAYRDYVQTDTSETAPQLSASDIAQKYGIQGNTAPQIEGKA